MQVPAVNTTLFLQTPVTTLIEKRFSCRTHPAQPVPHSARQRLQDACTQLTQGPLGARLRFDLLAAHPDDPKALRGLGTYGEIKKPAGFIIGAVQQGPFDLEQYGYAMQWLILLCTELELGTCWLGGSFTRSSFSHRLGLRKDECLPAVTSVGCLPEEYRDYKSGPPHARKRQEWQALFFDDNFDTPLSQESAGRYAQPLEMVRIAPSARNKQPWRVLRQGDKWHFYIQHVQDKVVTIFGPLLQVVDLPRLDIGIAMCHFELTARACGLDGHWVAQAPAGIPSEPERDYIITWQTTTTS